MTERELPFKERINHEVVTDVTFEEIKALGADFREEDFKAAEYIVGIRIEEKLAAFASLIKDPEHEGYFYDQYRFVNPEYRGHNLGTVLSQKRIDYAREHNGTGITGLIIQPFSESYKNYKGKASLASAVKLQPPITVYSLLSGPDYETGIWTLQYARHFTEDRFPGPHLTSSNPEEIEAFLREKNIWTV
jgi:GNAT superfamily N-acetyltransferase